MTNFDMKQWLQENRVGPYKGLLKEDLGDPQARADHEDVNEDKRNAFIEGFKANNSLEKLEKWVREERYHYGNDINAQELLNKIYQLKMEEEDDENGGMVNNVSMGTVAEARGSKTFVVDLEEEPFFILGKEYMVSGKVDVEISSDEEGFVIDHAAITITDIREEDDEQYTEIKDPVKIKMLQDLINTDKKLQHDLEDAVADKGDFGDYEDDSDWSGSEVDEQMGVGYASITKPSDPNRRPPLEM